MGVWGLGVWGFRGLGVLGFGAWTPLGGAVRVSLTSKMSGNLANIQGTSYTKLNNGTGEVFILLLRRNLANTMVIAVILILGTSTTFACCSSLSISRRPLSSLLFFNVRLLPSFLLPTPYTLYIEPRTLNSTPQTLNLTPKALN